MNSMEGEDELFWRWRRRESSSQEKVHGSDGDAGGWARIGRWLATTMVRGRGAGDGVEGDAGESSMSPGVVTTLGSRRRSAPSAAGAGGWSAAPVARSRRLE